MIEFGENGDRPRWPAPTAEAIAALREKYPSGDFYQFQIGQNVMIVRPPTRGEFGKFRIAVADDAKRPFAAEALTRDCVLYPDRQEVARLLDEWPALGEKVANKIGALGLAGEEIEVKKLG